jgi:hypothetical protein
MAGETYKPDWKQKLVAELSRDKKKTCILATLMLLGVVVSMRLVFKTNPAAAQAKTHATAGAPAKTPKTASKLPVVVGVGSDARIEERIRLNDRRIDRDIFVPDVMAFPPAPKPKAPVATGTDKTGVKSKEEIVKELAEKLTLQSTIISATPTAIINGEFLNVQGTIDGFTVTEITSGSCDVVKDGVTVRLLMERDEEEEKKKS